MIIFGTRPKHKTLGEGQFFCPRCQAQRAYKHKRATRYFTLYFVPVIPVGSMGEFIECQGCGTAFEMSVLEHKPGHAARQGTPNLAQMINTLEARLRDGVPVEYIVRDLTATGIDRAAALAMVKPHLEAGTIACDTCGLSYAAGVSTCAGCNQPL